MNYKKSLISLVAVMALSGTTSADSTAKYLPLTNASNDSSWVLFGVNGFSSGVATPFGNSSTGYSPDYTELVEADTTDNLETTGMGTAPSNLVSLLALQDAALTGLKIGIDITGIPYEATEPVRSMYVKVNSSTPNVKIDYKASLEGKRVEIYIDAFTTLYTTTLAQTYNYANAATAIEDELTTSTNADLVNIVDVLDMNSTENPVDPKYYSKVTNLEAVTVPTSPTAVFYHFDSVSQQWKIWNASYTGAANDFTKFSKGDAYWGKVDYDDTTNDADGATTLILGTSGDTDGIPNADVYTYDDNVTSKLTTGWNMLALDDIKPYVRHAATGMVVATTNVDGNITLTDSTGVHSLFFEIGAGTANAQAVNINSTLESAKLLGTVPTTFNVKAFQGSGAGQLVFISDAKFTLLDNNDTAFTTAATLTGGIPYNELGFNTTAITDVNDTRSATSVYGEYALMIQPMVGTKTADGNTSVNGGFSKIAFGDATNGDHTTIAMTATGQSDINTSKAQIEASDAAYTGIDFIANQIDTDFDGLEDMLIVAENDTPFYVKDKTYSRVFTVDFTDANTTTTTNVVTATGATATGTTAVTTLQNADALATAINTTGATTGVYAGTNVAQTQLIALSTVGATFDLKDANEGTADVLENTTGTEQITKGAIGAIYALDAIASSPIKQHTWTATGFDFSGLPLGAADLNVTVWDAGSGKLPTVSSDIIALTNATSDDTNTTGILAIFDDIVSKMNVVIATAKMHAYAYHDYNDTVDNQSSAKIVVIGMDVNDTNGSINGAGLSFTAFADDADALTLGDANSTTSTFITPMIADLKSNAIHTPNFAEYGPLYTMRSAGYDVKAILKAETKMSDSSIVWDGIDLTRDEEDWFLNNEFNLFNANLKSGYWVYLETKSADTIVISTPTLSSTYSYYFDNDTDLTTTNKIVSGQLSVTITGMNTVTSSAYVSVGGTTTELKRNGTSNAYTADITSYAMTSFAQNDSAPISFTIRATNGKGDYNTTVDALAYDFGAPTLSAPTFPDLTTVAFSASDSNVTFHLFNGNIPEVADDRAAKLVNTYTSATGSASSNICASLAWTTAPYTLRVVAADGTGVLGTSNVSDAKEFSYAVMIKGAQVLTHVGGSAEDKTIIGTRYNTSCVLDATQPAVATDNTGVSLKALTAGQTARLSYNEKTVPTNDLSGAYTKIFSIAGTNVIQVQSLNEYAGDTFFVEYGGSMYTGVFPSADLEAAANLTAISPSNTTLAP